MIRKNVAPLAFNSRMAGQNGVQKFGSAQYLDFASLVLLDPDFRREDE